MTLTLTLSPELEEELLGLAAENGTDPAEYLTQLIHEKLKVKNSGSASTTAPLDLEPLPRMEGSLPPGWKDAIYSKS